MNDRRTTTIDRDGITERHYADRCVFAPPTLKAPKASTNKPMDLAEKVTEGTRYAVERLLEHWVMEDGITDLTNASERGTGV